MRRGELLRHSRRIPLPPPHDCATTPRAGPWPSHASRIAARPRRGITATVTVNPSETAARQSSRYRTPLHIVRRRKPLLRQLDSTTVSVQFFSSARSLGLNLAGAAHAWTGAGGVSVRRGGSVTTRTTGEPRHDLNGDRSSRSLERIREMAFRTAEGATEQYRTFRPRGKKRGL